MTKAAELAALIGAQTSLANRNFVINGAMNVAQRSASVTGLGDGDEGYVTLDRVRHTAAASAGRFTSAQTAISDLPGFLNCLHLDCTTADTSIAATELLVLEHRMEGQNLQQLKKGTSSAESITVSFYMKTNAAFVFMCVLNDFDNNRVNTQKFTTTTDWTRHSITFVGDTTGALGDDANNSLSVSFYLHAGSNFTGGTYVSNTWQSRASSDNMIAPGIDSFYSSTDNDVKLTGLQMEIGETATPFEHEDIGTTLEKCQRYYVKLLSDTTYDTYGPGIAYVTTQFYATLRSPTRLRGNPSIGSSGNFAAMANGSHHAVDAAPVYNRALVDGMTVEIYFDMTTNNLVAGHACQLRNNNDSDAFIELIAEI